MVRSATAGHARLRITEHASETPEATHDVHAVDENGESLFITASAWSEEEAERDHERIMRSDADWPDGVYDYVVRER